MSPEPGDDEAALIPKRAERIAARHPELREEVLAFAQEQAAEYLYLEENFAGTIWVLRKSGC